MPPLNVGKALGLHLGDELIAAGLGGLPISWDENGNLFGRDQLDAAQQATLDAVIAAHDATTPPARSPIQEKINIDPAMKALIRRIARKEGLTVAQVISELEAEIP